MKNREHDAPAIPRDLVVGRSHPAREIVQHLLDLVVNRALTRERRRGPQDGHGRNQERRGDRCRSFPNVVHRYSLPVCQAVYSSTAGAMMSVRSLPV